MTHVQEVSVESRDCVEWPWARTGRGYGTVYNPKNRKFYGVHRAAYEAAYGPIPEGMVVMHICDNKACFAIEHLTLGTQKDNVHDALNKSLFIPGGNKIPESIREAIRNSAVSRQQARKEYGISSSSFYNIKNYG